MAVENPYGGIAGCTIYGGDCQVSTVVETPNADKVVDVFGYLVYQSRLAKDGDAGESVTNHVIGERQVEEMSLEAIVAAHKWLEEINRSEVGD